MSLIRVSQPVKYPTQQDVLDPSFISNYGRPAGLWTPTFGGANIAYDFSGNGNNGTLNGGVTLAAGSGQFPAAWKFDGGTGVIPIGNIHANPIFIWAVINPTAIAAGVYHTIVAKRDGSTNATEYAFDIEVSGKLRFYVNNGGFAIWVATTVLTVGKTIFVGVKYNGTTNPTFFLNNTTDAISSPATPIAMLQNSVNAEIGWFVNASATDVPFQGNIYAVGIHPINPTSAQVSSLYSTLMTGVPFAFMQPRTLWLPTGAGAAPTAPSWVYTGMFG
ncbi:MAG: hypothetical protein KGJ13_12605 [Patescibacteria group bacterium]|nr:hypothetical protein [Patescibacteria group bacterium]